MQITRTSSSTVSRLNQQANLLRFQGDIKRAVSVDVKQFKTPKPSKIRMKISGYINRTLMLYGLGGVPGLTRISAIDFPKAEEEKLVSVVNPNHAFFIGPNHPEFLTDWMVDKELSHRYAPEMACWANMGIVNGMGRIAQYLWLRQNLIANVPGGGGKEYSVRWALKGKGVLLHPEGMVNWTGDKVHQFFDGTVDMSFEAAKRSANANGKPVYIVPTVYKQQFVGDVSQGLQKEMAKVEKQFQLPVSKGLSVVERFAEIQKNILRRKEEEFLDKKQKPAAPIIGQNFFERQQQLFNTLLDSLEQEYGQQEGPLGKRIARLEKAIKVSKETSKKTSQSGELKQKYKLAFRKINELRRLMGFSAEVYNKPYLTQEHIAESLKRIKAEKGGLQKMFPIPVGQRIAHIRVVDPINVSGLLMSNGEFAVSKEALLQQIQNRMQAKLDELNREIQPEVSQYQVENPFYQPKFTQE